VAIKKVVAVKWMQEILKLICAGVGAAVTTYGILYSIASKADAAMFKAEKVEMHINTVESSVNELKGDYKLQLKNQNDALSTMQKDQKDLIRQVSELTGTMKEHVRVDHR